MTTVGNSESAAREGKFSPNELQRAHYKNRRSLSRIEPTRSPVVMRHLHETLSVLTLKDGDRVLELGCGKGRFSRLLASRGLVVTALDVSRDLVEAMHSELNPDESRLIEPVCCPAQKAGCVVRGRFRAVLGFFFLHHLREMGEVFAQARELLEAGGGIAFCEPNAFNPLYYLQVSLSPGMSWKVERGIPSMRSSVVFAAMRAAGFTDMRERAYGVLPPAMADSYLGACLERRLERLVPQTVATAYRVFSARVPP